VHTTLASYTLGNHVENGRILASGAANLTGNALNNLLYAGTGNNVLDGGAGSDTVTWAYGVSGASRRHRQPRQRHRQRLRQRHPDRHRAPHRLVERRPPHRRRQRQQPQRRPRQRHPRRRRGADTLAGGDGNDELSGGLGADVFRFDTLPNATTNRDTILDFSVVDDTIQLENAIFTSLAATGTLAAGSFRSGAGVTAAADADDFVIYDSSSGALYYDANGNTGAGPVQIASLASGLDQRGLTSLDFLVT
jgi:Ca2+-binding RTX toxin-like protein